ncbi:uncharacterized protein N7482_005738 [Penicillium canariense]|uniref:Ankyrin repeat-containing domain protein n=1 Tax=Penicillium canariense TaxID=189055 RepID=A0A9W9I742_9EURO|nr:uncharacterized protein N7482_005738 [Penicillium canariense]KAJ5166957.1 hypothetical protein N7482_005738 [Penicillium canariense]
MSLLGLQTEILLLIAQDLDLRGLNTLLQSHSVLYSSLNRYLYAYNVKHGKGPFPRAKHLRYRKLRRSSKPSERHPISNAAKNGHTAIVTRLLDCGLNVNYKSRFGRSPLALAARGGHFDTVKMLVSRGACLLSVDLDGQRPIAYAARQGHNAIADYLLERLRSRYPRLYLTAEADIQIMLQHAAWRGDEARAKYLLSKEGAEIDFQLPFESWSPLCAVVQGAPLTMIKLLLENGANPNARESPKRIGNPGRARTPMRLAIQHEDSCELISLLLQHGANAGQDSDLVLAAAAAAGKADEFRVLVEHGADIDDSKQQASFMRAALRSNCRPIADMLVEIGANPKRRVGCRLYRPRRPEPGSMRTSSGSFVLR